MKFLATLSVLQFAAIAALLFKFVSLESSMDALAIAQSNTAIRESATSLALAVPITSQATARPSEEQLRNIVREELAAALLAFPTPQTSQQSPTVALRADSEARRESEYQRELVENKIDDYVTQGSISDQEMSDLQMQLVKLDHSGRKLVLRKLTKALNSGDLEGRL